MPDNKPMTPEEFAKRLAADKYISLTYEQRITMKLSEWAESIRRDAKREAAIYCYDAAKGPYVDWNKIIAYIQSLSSAPIDTPPAADRAPEAVCPRCEGRKEITIKSFMGLDDIPCPDCHGTGKRADANEYRYCGNCNVRRYFKDGRCEVCRVYDGTGKRAPTAPSRAEKG